MGNVDDENADHNGATKNPFMVRNAPNAFQAIFGSGYPADLSLRGPSRQDALTLWRFFSQRVNPVLRISFDKELACLNPENRKQLTDVEHTLTYSIYLLTVLSLSDEECRRELQQPRSLMVSHFQTLCEESLSHTNPFCVTNITVLKALAIYLVSLNPCFFVEFNNQWLR